MEQPKPYEPNKKEIKKAEEMMTEDQKKDSKERTETLEVGKKLKGEAFDRIKDCYTALLKAKESGKKVKLLVSEMNDFTQTRKADRFFQAEVVGFKSALSNDDDDFEGMKDKLNKKDLPKYSDESSDSYHFLTYTEVFLKGADGEIEVCNLGDILTVEPAEGKNN